MDLVTTGIRTVARTALDVVPIAAFIMLFQTLVLRRPLVNPGQVVTGFLLVVVGLGFFLLGLEQALFPLGRLMATQLTDADFIGLPSNPGLIEWQAYYWVYVFALTLGFSTAIAEPAVLAVALKANQVSGGAIRVRGLRIAVALGVAIGVCLGCFRIVTGTPMQYYIIACYIVVVVQTVFAPKLIVPLAYDSGGVTTSTVTVPLVAALGLGLAQTVPGRSPVLDGFGLVAFACLFPIITVLGYAQLSIIRAGLGSHKTGDSTSQREEDHHAL